MEIIRKYPSSFGKWYAQVRLDGQSVELSFDSDPSEQDIQRAVEALTAVPVESSVVLEAEDGTVV